jgi:hypothetical protein
VYSNLVPALGSKKKIKKKDVIESMENNAEILVAFLVENSGEKDPS